MHVGLFGGSFDPIHLGHLILAESAREQCNLDRVLFMPSAVSPHKREKCVTSGDIRAEMILAAIEGNPDFELSREEIDYGGVSYTYQTLERLGEKLQASRMFLLLGADMFNDLSNWREPRRICRAATPVPVGRGGEAPIDFELFATIAVSLEQVETSQRLMVDMPPVGISSTMIRERVAAGRSIRYLTPEQVIMLIGRHDLYR